jgi:UDP-glucose 4-epimerase
LTRPAGGKRTVANTTKAGAACALVTGAAGFIGSHVADHCLAQGMKVVAVDDLSGGFRENVPESAQWVQGDVRDPEFVAKLWQNNRFDYVYHLAAYAAEGLSHFIRRYNYETNLVGSINLINQAVEHETKCFVFTSSIAVYGSNQVPMTEDLVPRPEDPYGISKYAVEMDLESAHKMFGLDYVILRPHNVFGERQNIADKYRNVIGIFMNQILHGGAMTIFGDGLQTRAFSYIDDVAPHIARAPMIPGAINQVFNLGSDTAYSVLELAQAVAAAFNVPCSIEHLPARNEVVHAFSDHSKARAVFKPPTPVALTDGINRMAEWVKRKGATRPVEFDNIEIHKNLPPSWRKR